MNKIIFYFLSVLSIKIRKSRKICKENYDLDIINIDPKFLSKLAKDHSNSKYGARDLIKEINSEIHLLLENYQI